MQTAYLGPTAQIAAWIEKSRSISFPESTWIAGRRAFVNWMACALGARADISAAKVFKFASAVSGRGDSSVIGVNHALDPVNAALVNGVAANALDYDDMHAPTLIHPTGPVVAAALAIAESRHASGELLLRAIIVGIEVQCLLGLALGPRHYDAGWHSTATLGTFGATAASSVVLGLDQHRIGHALGIASTLAGGLRSMLSNSCKSLNVGKAAAAGVSAALLAEAEFDSEPRALEARHGFFDVFGQPLDHSILCRSRSDPYIVEETSLKPYPCGIVIHPLVDACLALAQPGRLSSDDVQRVSAWVHPRAIELANRPHPASALEGRYSLQHAAALAFARGCAGLAEFDDVPMDDPEVRRWRELLVVSPDPAADIGQARVIVDLKDGAHRKHAVKHPTGSPEQPLTDEQLHRKFTELARRALADGDVEKLHHICLTLDRLPDVNTLRRHWQSDALANRKNGIDRVL